MIEEFLELNRIEILIRLEAQPQPHITIIHPLTKAQFKKPNPKIRRYIEIEEGSEFIISIPLN